MPASIAGRTASPHEPNRPGVDRILRNTVHFPLHWLVWTGTVRCQARRVSDTITARLRAICDLNVARARAEAGRHEYDGRLQDLSPAGVRAGLARLAPPTEPATGHDQRQLAAAEHALRVRFGELALHRRNPLWHLDNLELMGYEREYAPLAEREAARLEHLRGWPDAVDAAIEALDQVPAPMAVATVGLARGLAEQLRPSDGATGEAATKALTRLIEH